MNKPHFAKKRLPSLIAAALVAGGLGTSAYADQISLVEDKFSISVDELSVTATLDSDGVLTVGGNYPRFDLDENVLSSDVLPTFRFEIDSSELTTNGIYSFKIGLSIEDEASTGDRRFEAYLGTLSLDVSDGSITASIPPEDLIVNARKDDVDVYQTIRNSSTNGPVTISGDRIIEISGLEAVELLSSKSPFFADVMSAFTLNGVFRFRVVIEAISGPKSVDVGVTSGLAVPKI